MANDVVDIDRLKQMRTMVRRSVARIRSFALRPTSQWYLLNAVLWGRIQWQLQLGTFTEKQIDSIEQAAKGRAIKAAGLSRHALSNDLVRGAAKRGGLEWQGWHDRTMARRLQIVHEALNAGGVLVTLRTTGCTPTGAMPDGVNTVRALRQDTGNVEWS